MSSKDLTSCRDSEEGSGNPSLGAEPAMPRWLRLSPRGEVGGLAAQARGTAGLTRNGGSARLAAVPEASQ
eukprot:6947359-Pyramimonas_sp.AAC.1